VVVVVEEEVVEGEGRSTVEKKMMFFMGLDPVEHVVLVVG
jgi:hypothetical protein